MRAIASSALLLFAACGASPTAEPSATPPASAGAEAPVESDQPREPENTEPTLAARILVRLEAHLADLRAAPRALQGDEAFALSSAIMDAIDAQPLPDPLRLRADQAAEAILTDRSPDGAIRAAKQALEVLQQVVDAEE